MQQQDERLSVAVRVAEDPAELGSQDVELPESVVLKRPGLRAYAGKEVSTAGVAEKIAPGWVMSAASSSTEIFSFEAAR